MKKIIPIFAALMLAGCGQTAQPSASAPETESASTTQEEVQEQAEDVTQSKFSIVQPSEVTQGRLEKMSIDDIYVMENNGENLLVVDYNFKQCFSQTPASFADTYIDAMFINSIEAEHFYGDIEGSEAGYDSKLLGLAKAHVFVGYKIKNYEQAKDKDFRLYLNLKDGTVMYEIEGNISNLRVEKE